MSISLNTLRRTAALASACLLGFAGTFLAVAQATQQPAGSLIRFAFSPSTELDPAISLRPARDPAASLVRVATVQEPGIVPWTATPGKFYVGSSETGPGGGSLWLLPATLTGADLPAGTTIRVRVAGGAGEIQTCSHSKGEGVTADGAPASGDGWDCSRLVVPSTSHRDQ